MIVPARVLAESAVRAGFLFAMWLLLVDETDLPNLVTGAVVAVLAALLAALLQTLRPVRLTPRPAMLRHAHRPFALLLTDTVRVLRVLALAIVRQEPDEGRIRAARYGACGDDGEDAARRVLTEWAASVGSNRYVIGIDADAGLLIVHELTPAPGPLDPLELG